jgi:hypothetical protein
MKTQSIDTSPDAECVLIGMIRQAPLSQRFSFVDAWSRSILSAGRLDAQSLCPQASEHEICFLHAQRYLDKASVDQLREASAARSVFPQTPPPALLSVLLPLVEALQDLGIAYALTGSLASSLYGMQRATVQLALLAALSPQHETSFYQRLGPAFVLRSSELQTALATGKSFSVVHLRSLLQLTVRLPNARLGEPEMLGRARSLVLAEESPPLQVLSAEDVVLLHVEQFRQSGGRADDLWYDVLGILKVQGTELDLVMLEQRAADLDLASLMHQAFVDAGLLDQ